VDDFAKDSKIIHCVDIEAPSGKANSCSIINYQAVRRCKDGHAATSQSKQMM